jgi:hypothetical protein
MTKKNRSATFPVSSTKVSSSRRRLLKALTAGGAGAAITAKLLPASWTRPVVDSVLLPAHAQATGFSGSFSTSGVVLADAGSTIMDLVVPRAHAGGPMMTTTVDICVNVTNNVAEIFVLVDSINLYGATGVAVPFSDVTLDYLGGAMDTILTTISGTVEPAGGGGNQLTGTVMYGSQGNNYTAPEVMGTCTIMVPG